jgi:GntR family transcriptional regulator
MVLRLTITILVRLRLERTCGVIDFQVDKAGSVPAYAQLVRQVREAMRLGLLQAGDRLPTVREVVTSCRVNAATVLKAYRELEMSGLVESRQGSGTFVTGTLGSADPHVMAGLRGGLARWLDKARDAGLEDEDVQALVTSVLAQQAAGTGRAGELDAPRGAGGADGPARAAGTGGAA